MEEYERTIYYGASGGFGMIASDLVFTSFAQMIPWLIVAGVAILADLVTALCRDWKLGNKIHPSRIFRDTLAKSAAYSGAVASACVYDVAEGGDGSIQHYTMYFIFGIEAISILGNILRYHGVNLDFKKTIIWIFTKIVNFFLSKKGIETTKEEIKELITEDNEDAHKQ